MFIPRKHANSLKKVKLRCRTVTLGGAGHHIHAHAYTDIIYYQQDCLTHKFHSKLVQVRGLPCAHNFHVECIDEWLRLNVKCPRCRCSVFPNLDLSALSNLRAETERSSASVMTTNRYVREPSSQSYLLRLQGLLRPVRTGNVGTADDTDMSLETIENGNVALATRYPSSTEPTPSVDHMFVGQATPLQHQTLPAFIFDIFLLYLLTLC